MAIRGEVPPPVIIACGGMLMLVFGWLNYTGLKNKYVDVGNGKISRYHRDRQPIRYWLCIIFGFLIFFVGFFDACSAFRDRMWH